VSRVGEQRNELSISSYENRSSVFVIPIDFENQLAESPKLIFEQVGDRHILSKVETVDGVYTLPEPRSANLVAGAKQQQAMSAAGTH
jgi:hypothetical protein